MRTRSSVSSCSGTGACPAGIDAVRSPSPPLRAPPPRRSPFTTTRSARSPQRARRAQLSHAAAALRRLRVTLRALARRQAATEAALCRLTHLVNVSIAHF